MNGMHIERTLPALLFLIMIKACCLAWSPSAGRSSGLTSCINLVAECNFRRNATVALFTTAFDGYDKPGLSSTTPAAPEQSLVQLLNQSKKFSLVILKSDEDSKYCSTKLTGKKAVDYFIFVVNTEDAAKWIRSFCFDKVTNDLTHIVVYIKGGMTDAKIVAADILRLLWKYHHQNVVVMVERQQEVDAYVWFPLEESQEVIVADVCNGIAFRNNTPLFPTKSPHNLRKRIIRAGVVIGPIATCDRIGGGYAGAEIEMMDAIALALNFTMIYNSSRELEGRNDSQYDDWKAAYGPWRTVLLRILSGEIDISVGGFNLIAARFERLDYTQPFAKDTFRFYATNDMILSRNYEGWMGLIVVQMIIIHIFTSLTMYQLRTSVDNKKGEFGNTAIMIWSLLSASSVKLSILSWREVLFWAIIAFYAMNVNTAYVSILTSLLASPTNMENIATVKDMVKSSLPFLLSTAKSIEEIPLLSRADELRLQKRLTACPEPLIHCLLKFVSVPDYCLSAFDRDMVYAQAVLPKRKYHRLDHKKGTGVHLAMYTTKNHFLNRKLTMMILRSAQAGLTSFWFTKNLGKHSFCDLNDPAWLLLRSADANRSVPENPLFKKARPYTMTDLYPPFLFGGLGLLLAGIAFVYELMSANSSCLRLWARLKRYFRVTWKGLVNLW